jgi:hypothetical protein
MAEVVIRDFFWYHHVTDNMDAMVFALSALSEGNQLDELIKLEMEQFRKSPSQTRSFIISSSIAIYLVSQGK